METTKYCKRCDTGKPESEWTPGTWVKSGQWCKACYRAWHRARYTPKDKASDDPRVCAKCGSSYQPKQRKLSWYCSTECKAEARSAAQIAARLTSKPADRWCLHCAGLMGPSLRSDAIFCSRECNGKAHALQRKLRARTGQDDKPGYLRAAICDRDGWRCGECRKRVDPVLVWPDPMCASLDHVITVSEGGLSTPANLRLVHLVCNERRRNVGGWEQLALL